MAAAAAAYDDDDDAAAAGICERAGTFGSRPDSKRTDERAYLGDGERRTDASSEKSASRTRSRQRTARRPARYLGQRYGQRSRKTATTTTRTRTTRTTMMTRTTTTMKRHRRIGSAERKIPECERPIEKREWTSATTYSPTIVRLSRRPRTSIASQDYSCSSYNCRVSYAIVGGWLPQSPDRGLRPRAPVKGFAPEPPRPRPCSPAFFTPAYLVSHLCTSAPLGSYLSYTLVSLGTCLQTPVSLGSRLFATTPLLLASYLHSPPVSQGYYLN